MPLNSSPRRTLYSMLAVTPRQSNKTSVEALQPAEPSQQFDRQCLYVTSPVFSPGLLAALRITTALYSLVSLIVSLERSIRRSHQRIFLSYFTNLSYVGLCAYLFAAGVQTVIYAIRGRRKVGVKAGYPLQESWPQFLQALHVILHATVVTFPFIVTIFYWVALSGSDSFEDAASAWRDISFHILNAVFALGELFLTNSPPVPWIALPITILFLAGYLAVGYMTFAQVKLYPYSFLDPSRSGKYLAAYIVGLAVGQCIIFAIVHYVAVLRQRIATKHNRLQPSD